MPEFLPGPNPLYQVLFILFALLFVVQMAYYWGLFSAIFRYREPPAGAKEEGVSVVICAHNEYLNLQENLPVILDQDYPNCEVIVVNHASDDDTSFLLASLADHHPRLKIVEIQRDLNFFTGKKFPLSIGIKSAKYDKILLTDADCRPSGSQWVREMSKAFTNGKEIVLGYGAYQKKAGLLNRMIRFDTAHIAIQFLSYALAGIPYMGVGRNLSYRKSLFYRHHGFISHYRIRSGDDDLFINRTARGTNTTVMLNQGSFTVSKPKDTLNRWIIQKKRHLSTARHYRLIHKLLLGSYSVSVVMFWALLITLLSLEVAWLSVFVILLLREGTRLILFGKWLRKLDEKDLIILMPLLEILTLFLSGGVALSNVFMKPSKWK